MLTWTYAQGQLDFSAITCSCRARVVAMSNEEQNPYGAEQTPAVNPKRMRTVHLKQFKDAGQKFSMLTSYDAMTAQLFDAAGVEVLLVGDSAANVVMGRSTTLPITVEEMLVFAKSVVNGATRALVVVDLPFGSYEVSPQQAVETSVRVLKESGAQAVKLEGGAARAEHIRAAVAAGVPVMAHVGFTPQSEHAIGGYRVQGRGDAAEALRADALAVEEAGAFAVVMEMVPAEIAAQLESELTIPTIGIGAGAATTGQVLVWQDMLGLGSGRVPRFVKQYANLREVITEAVTAYRADVTAGTFPAPEHTFE